MAYEFLPGDLWIAQLLSIIKIPLFIWEKFFLTFDVEGELILLLKNYLYNREQRVALNGKTSEWNRIYSGVPQELLLGPLLFVIYINNLPDGITSMLLDDTSLFSNVLHVIKSVIELNTGLEKINQSAYQEIMQFNPDSNKQANEVTFSRKSISHNLYHPPIGFSERVIMKSNCQKHFGIILNSILNFNTHIDQKIKKCNKFIGLIRRLSVNLPRNALLAIHKSFIRPHIDYGDILYDKPNNENSQNKIGKVQYRTCLAIAGATQRTSREKN